MFLSIILSIASVFNTTDASKQAEEVNPIRKAPSQTETVYVATNNASENSIVAFNQNQDGSLTMLGEYPTQGKGTGNIEIFDWGYDNTHPLKDGVDPLISAYGIQKTQDNSFVLVVNSGDASISSLKVNADKSLTFADKEKAGDIHPLSIATYGKVIYVASAGDGKTPPFSGNITGYTIDINGKLTPIENSTRNLNARPSCVAFTPDGKFLVVNELVTGLVKVFEVTAKGNLSEKPVSSIGSPHDAPNGRWLPIPVGFDIVNKNGNNIVLVSEARFLNNKGMLREEAGKVPQSPKYSWQTGSTSSYVIDEKGSITLVSPDVKTGSAKEGGQIANCWVEVSKDGNTLWAANALSSSISSYAIESEGDIELSNGTTFKDKSETKFFSDLYLSQSGRYLYQLIGNEGAVMVFKVNQKNNKLSKVGYYTATQLPKVGAYGIISL
ncbi:lactonase family protein [Galbibacter mesophilus]|uniref:lactonase family protein n=1 Tax=Galbibacter mesophilus TaxID=379069 RepID=UPI00191CFA83|nr:beta-propeller fold lactonase family protein [Galbibacter mesophilus]MCM5662200.1 lactonase family protein [Galbibacter mesophilus]